MKTLTLACSLFAFAISTYAQSPLKINAADVRASLVQYVDNADRREYPAPAVGWAFGGTGYEDLQHAIMTQVIHEVVRRSDRPIASFRVGVGQDQGDIIMSAVWYDGAFTDWFFTLNADGSIPSGAWENAFIEDECDDSGE